MQYAVRVWWHDQQGSFEYLRHDSRLESGSSSLAAIFPLEDAVTIQLQYGQPIGWLDT
jgi:hypothetical protein